MSTLVVLALLAAGGGDTLLVSPGWLAERLGTPGIVVLHAGSWTEFREGHIPGARLAHVMSFHAHEGGGFPPAEGMRAALEEEGVSDGSRIVVVGDGMFPAIVYVALEYLGLGSRASILDGGLPAWRAAGHPVATDDPPSPTSRGRITASVRTDVQVDAAWLTARLNRPEIAVLDARSPGEYQGSADEDIPRKGHIPGARLLQWTDVSDSTTGAFRPPEQLRQLFASRGVEPGDTVVTYCTVGMRASHLYFAARLLGLPARIYVGSMNDWSRRAELPVLRGRNPE